MDNGRVKLLTFQTWVTRWDWYSYAKGHRERVPHVLTDRSPCPDPFFDPFAPMEERRPLISGLCRGLKSFAPGDLYIYITAIDPKVYAALGLGPLDWRKRYLGVAALRVRRVWESHAEAAATFDPRRYVVDPDCTPYPPNLAHDPRGPAAVARSSCIVHVGTRPYTPDHSDDRMWRGQYLSYHRDRQRDRKLRVAECVVERVGGREALRLVADEAPILTPADWGGRRMQVMGLPSIDKGTAAQLCARIAGEPAI